MLGLGSNIIKSPVPGKFIVTDNLVLRHGYALNPVHQVSTGAAYFVESNTDYISISDHNDFSFGDGSTTDSAFSISAWINPIDATRFSIITKATASAVEWRFYGNASDKLELFLGDDTISVNEKRVSTASISQNSWTHVACTYNGVGGASASGGINLYINGVLDNGTADGFATYAAMHNHAIGVNIGFDDYDDQYADGYICNVGVWDAVLTQAQVKSIMWKKYEDLISSETTSLVSWYNLSADANDSTANANNGTLA